MNKRVKIQIHGAVQGVGFRPFVYRLATELGIKGWIVNSSQGVFIDAEGTENSVTQFLERIRSEKPANSRVQSFDHSYTEPCGFEKFEIRLSDNRGAKTALVLPDLATCPDCTKEIFDSENRRYLYPFTNCTNCGPRFSIISTLPYDRANTTMREFVMCDKCLAEYTDPLNRRFHAEPIACPDCGPSVMLWNEKGETIAEKNDAIFKCADLIKEGKIIALKGIGGFQLLVDAASDEAAKELRLRKHRSEKPFALMFPDIESIKSVCEVSAEEEQLLRSTEAPIVLLKKKKNTESVVKISSSVAVNNPYLGVMLPYSPLHHILMSYFKIPVIATSGNISEEPICTDENTALIKLKGIADYYLVHNRKILRHVDDSIIRIAAGDDYMLRRARGYAPFPVESDELNETVLATGAHLKNTIAINKDHNVFISQHIGDLENPEAINAFENVIEDFKSFYQLQLEKVIADMHPDYVSTKYALENYGKKVHLVQHHYAHVLSCMAENNIEGDVLGVSWDGTGYGTDGTIWGSEFIIPQGKEFKRVGHIRPFKIPGGEKAIEQVWRLGFSLLYELYGEGAMKMDDLKLISEHKKELKLLGQMIDKNINSPVTTSMGRLFDGIASIIGIRDSANYEAQAAMELEFAADDYDTNDYFAYDIEIDNGTYIFNWERTIKEITEALRTGIEKKVISAKFHNTIAEVVVQIAKSVKLNKVILTGGCFLNKYLLERTIKRLEEEKFKVYHHKKVPSGDGGISLGQMKYSTYIDQK